ncbi:MAG TPA: lytic transglycosylase domain-containing protein [bacterium]|nr:lytic transglycosylase domain-containing protein [bacterium]HOL46963.1 lytic transglycosylase domain-containing protein [bacterium]HPQ18228.1 lytic transglycosylase domain-containing protein [bacterium]
MLEGLYKIFDRISYLQKRFNFQINGLEVKNEETEIKKFDNTTFSKILKNEIKNNEEKINEDEAKKIDEVIKTKAEKYNLNPNLIKAIIKAESNFNKEAVSEKGAAGLMQLLPSTAKELGVKNIFDIEENIEGGTKYFKMLLEKYNGDVQKALAAYNAGFNNVDKYQDIPPFVETQQFIKSVLKNFNEEGNLDVEG